MSLTATELAENECPAVPGWSYTSGHTAMDWGSGTGLCLVSARQAAAALRARAGDPAASLHVAEGTLIVSLGDSVTRQDLFAVGTGGRAWRLTAFGTGTGSFGAGAGQVVFPAPDVVSGPTLPSASLFRYGARGAAPLAGKWGSDADPPRALPDVRRLALGHAAASRLDAAGDLVGSLDCESSAFRPGDHDG